jgi:hypothetical protein
MTTKSKPPKAPSVSPHHRVSEADGLKAFSLLAPALESLAALHVKIGEQRAASISAPSLTT